MLKKTIFLFLVILFYGCKDAVVEKPKNLLDEKIMVDIYYDLALLEAIKVQDLTEKEAGYNSSRYICKKYNIDSLQFVQNHNYYVSKTATFKKIFDKVKSKLENENRIIDSIMKSKGEEITPYGGDSGTLSKDIPQIQ